jgi:hypothetical protein
MGLRVRLKNTAEPREADWWLWSVWLDGREEDLDKVQSVKYVLHPTFPDPVRVVTDRQSKFRLSALGWGEFSIAAEVSTDTGESLSLERWITFEDPRKKAAEDAGRKPSVFLSYSAMDRPLVKFLSDDLKRQGVDVVAPEDMIAGSSWSAAIGDLIRRAHVVAFLVSGELRGFAEQELALAQQGGKPVVPILVGNTSQPPEALAGMAAMHLRSPNDAGPVADLLAARAKDLFHDNEA